MNFLKQFEILVYCLLFSLAGSAHVCAETLVEFPPPEFEEEVEHWVSETQRNQSPFYKQRLREEPYLQKIQSGQVNEIVADLLDKFTSQNWGENQQEQVKVINVLNKFQAALSSALKAPEIEGALDTVEEQNSFLGRLNQHEFGLTSLAMETIVDDNGNDVPAYFAETENELVLYEYVELDGRDRYRLLLTTAQVSDWRLLEHTLTSLVHNQTELLALANIRALQNAVVRWDNFLNNGYSQMPWEALINGRLIKPPGFPEPGPPTHQWLLLHPALGLEFSASPVDESRVKEVMHIELLGHIWYRGAQHDDYRGFSLTASLREDRDPGLGVMFHLRRNWSVGFSWRGAEDDPSIFLSVDLFGFARESASQYQRQYQDLRERLDSDKSSLADLLN